MKIGEKRTVEILGNFFKKNLEREEFKWLVNREKIVCGRLREGRVLERGGFLRCLGL